MTNDTYKLIDELEKEMNDLRIAYPELFGFIENKYLPGDYVEALSQALQEKELHAAYLPWDIDDTNFSRTPLMVNEEYYGQD